MLLNYALIEDEPPAMARLKRMLKALRPEAQCLGDAQDGESGLELLRQTRPQLLFLDIEFPPLGAFGLLQEARSEGLELPPIVFTTAYDHYAVEAFRWGAWDYVLKPMEADRLEETLARVESRSKTASMNVVSGAGPDTASSMDEGDRPIASLSLRPPRAPHVVSGAGPDTASSTNEVPDLESLLRTMEALRQQQPPEQFTVQFKGHLKVLRWKHVSHLATENRLLFVHTPEGRFVLDRTLDELEKILAPRFLRCHRSAMIALDRVAELVPDPGGTGEVRMADGSRLPVSRERMPELRKRLG